MQKKQIETENGYMNYEIKNNTVIITGFQGMATRIRLPGQINGYPVAVVDRKAFLSQKSLYAISFPDTIEEVGDWAFANCDNLTEISFPRREVRFGRTVFKNCGKLKRIEVRNLYGGGESVADVTVSRKLFPVGKMDKTEWQSPDIPELLAATVTMLDAYYLLDIQTAGSREWLEKWDTRLISVLHTPDQEGYISQSVYGEEDYIGTDLEEYTNKRRKEKVRLAYLRLLHPQALSLALKQELEDYLRSLTKGQETEEAWQVLKEEYSSDREYYKLFAELSCLTMENFDGILEDIGDNSPEIKAFFLKSMEGQREETVDFFESLEL